MNRKEAIGRMALGLLGLPAMAKAALSTFGTSGTVVTTARISENTVTARNITAGPVTTTKLSTHAIYGYPDGTVGHLPPDEYKNLSRTRARG